MAKYGLQRGIRGSEARHTTTAQYYRDLKRQTGELEANVQQLQTERQQAKQELDEVKKEIKSEKLEAAKTEAKAALVAKVGSLLGSGRLKELEADNRTLQGEIAARDESRIIAKADGAAAGGTQPPIGGTASQVPQGNGGQGSGTPRGSVIPKIHYPKSQEMVSAVSRAGVYGEVLP